MSRRRFRSTKARACVGKEPMSREDAQGKAERLERAGSFRMLHYHCRHCNFWHVGHPPRPKV